MWIINHAQSHQFGQSLYTQTIHNICAERLTPYQSKEKCCYSLLQVTVSSF